MFDNKNIKSQIKKEKEINLLLPNEIGSRIIELQMQTQQLQTLNKNIIQNLMVEYSKAIQFYQERGNKKYKVYQKKMKNFLQRPTIHDILQGKNADMAMKKQFNQRQLNKANRNIVNEVKQILLDSNKNQQKKQQTIHTELQFQNKHLQQRIQRKKAISNRTSRDKYTSNSSNLSTKNKQTFLDKMQFINQFKIQTKKVYL